MKPMVVALYSPNVGTKSHATGCTIPAAHLLAQRGRFRPVVVGGSSPILGTHAQEYELVSLPVDFSYEEGDRFLGLGPLSTPLWGVTRVIQSWRHIRRFAEFLTTRPDISLVHFFEYEYLTLSRFIQKATRDQRSVVTVYLSDFG